MFGMGGGKKRRKRAGPASRDEALGKLAANSEIVVTPGQPGPVESSPITPATSAARKSEDRANAAACDGRGTSVQVRWMIHRDMDDVLHIERHSFAYPWTDEDFTRALRQRNCIGMVAECRITERILGFMIYELHQSSLHLLNLAIHPDHRRSGIGCTMIDRLRGKLSLQRRTVVETEVRETNLDAQLFFRRLGFRAESVLFDFYRDWEIQEDAFVFRWRHGWSEGPTVVGPATPQGVLAGGLSYGGRLAGLFGKQE